uniref:Uncharacterized protein n=1 Tax=Vespula pensylvanica TaxID=30213 RepID=A0A834U7K7_VESPE|nr:hypothetical protein H0235_010302 [Vespula pensylvanica]
MARTTHSRGDNATSTLHQHVQPGALLRTHASSTKVCSQDQVDDSDRQRFPITDQECEDVSWISVSCVWKRDGHEKMSTLFPDSIGSNSFDDCNSRNRFATNATPRNVAARETCVVMVMIMVSESHEICEKATAIIVFLQRRDDALWPRRLRLVNRTSAEADDASNDVYDLAR